MSVIFGRKRLILLSCFFIPHSYIAFVQNTPRVTYSYDENNILLSASTNQEEHLNSISHDEEEDNPFVIQTESRHKKIAIIQAYASYWDKILMDEYRATVEELKERRNTWSRSRLESSGICIFGASAEPDSEVFGDKIVRIYKPNGSLSSSSSKSSGKSNAFRDNFSRGDVLVLTPENNHGLGHGFDVPIIPRECLVVDVGSDWLTVAVGPSWPVGLWETRRKGVGAFLVRLDRTAPQAPMKAQQSALERIRRGEGGAAANIFAGLFHCQSSLHYLKESREQPNYFHSPHGNLTDDILNALEQAKSDVSFKPNQSQCEAITWALQRKVSLIRGPPGTGKTRCAALLIATALKMKSTIMAEIEGDESKSISSKPPRILAVTHSNGAADVLLQALLNTGVPAVRLGRPSSVNPNVQHRTVVAIAEKIPAVLKLRQKSNDATLDNQSRASAEYDLRQYISDVEKVIIETAPVIVASCIGANQLFNENVTFPLVVLDEAAQSTEPALTCALATAKAEQVILVGDSKQLPPTITSMDLKHSLGISPMSRLENAGVDEMTLSVQYRMPPELLEHPSNYFYEGLVRCATTLQKREHKLPSGFPWPKSRNGDKCIPLAFINSGKNNEYVHNFGGKSNPNEAKLVINIISSLIKNDEILAKNIAVITPYSKQVQLIRMELANKGTGNKNSMHQIKVGTVDSFQGQETDIVIFSAVRSNELKEMGFLRDPRRLNVAITRSKRGLIIVGDKTLLKTCRHWESLIESCERRGCIVDSVEFEGQHSVLEIAKPSTKEEKEILLDETDEFYGLFI